MDAAVVSMYQFGAGEGSQDATFAVPAPHMAVGKRRRVEADEYARTNLAAGAFQGAADVGQHHQQQQSGPPPYGSSGFVGAFAHSRAIDYSTAASGSGLASAAVGSVNEGSVPRGEWQTTASMASVSPYPDVASYSQQPYFFQQTHPSTYNSPWPPGESAMMDTTPDSYSGAPAAGPQMPYFPPRSTAETDDVGYEVAPAQQQHLDQIYGQDAAAVPPFTYASGNENGVPRSDVPPQASAFLYEDASMHLKVQSLPILENLATQLIHTIAKASFPQIQEIMNNKDDEDSQAYTTLKNLFDQTRKVYSRETPLIDAIAIQMFQPNQQETIRKANIATFLSSILGAHDVSFFHLNEFFMETFVPLGHRLLKWQGAVYLELKTQTYISATMNSDGSPEAMLDELFPSDLDAQILTRHPDAPSLSPSEQDFIDRSRQRKSYLLAENSGDETVVDLPKKYSWQDFVREFASSVSKNIDAIMNVPGGTSDKRNSAAAQAFHDSLLGGKTGSASMNGSSVIGREDGTKKGSSSAPTVRQAWSKQEEDALLSGLEKVEGPHWSQILALYGRGGSISEVLKDRNQVQLKDKARNLKLSHLKMGKEVPFALRGVTGELRKRGGARARAALEVNDDDADAEGDGGMEVDEKIARPKAGGRKKSRR